MILLPLEDILPSILLSLSEDIGTGDITAALVSPHQRVRAHIIVNEPAIICGRQWMSEVFKQVDADIALDWQVSDGDSVENQQAIVYVTGLARSILTAERCALNWLQTLSGTATTVAEYVQLITHTQAKILDTRKTIPGLRLAQKYAVKMGGGYNHRMGLFDAFLIKENHILSCGSISAAVAQARKLYKDRPLEVEVENIDELEQALDVGVKRVMCDNFTLPLLKEAVKLNKGAAELEASGNVNFSTIKAIAETGVDYISLGAITKNVRAIDFSLRVIDVI